MVSAATANAVPGATPLLAAQLAVVVNDADPNSVEVGEYYRQVRQIPKQNMVHVRIAGRPRRLTAAQFAPLRQQIMGALGPQVQAVLLLWTGPYAVECNSITNALTLGFDPEACTPGCHPSKPNPYYNASSAAPNGTPGRPILSMLLPTDSVATAKAVIDRGVASGFRMPVASAYYLITSDVARGSRVPLFPRSGTIASKKLAIKVVTADTLAGAGDVMVYETGQIRVANLETLRFLPGALADHLTSTGGDLLDNSQMSALRWLEAGATASYGTVSEPCNFWQKFPQPSVLLAHYLSGDSAIEAYWKSVMWPAQGLFIGEPLAAPYRH